LLIFIEKIIVIIVSLRIFRNAIGTTRKREDKKVRSVRERTYECFVLYVTTDVYLLQEI